MYQRITVASPVLTICEDLKIRKITTDALSLHDVEVIEMEGFEDAFEILLHRQDICGLVATAYQVGILNGFELIRIAEREWPFIHRLVVIGSQAPEPAQLALSARFIPSPLNVDALVALMTKDVVNDRQGGVRRTP